MTWRKWLVRAVVFSVIGGAASLAWLFQYWTNPEAVRNQVVHKIQEMFPGASVTLDSARLRLLGGILLTDLRLARRDDPERRDFAYFPEAMLFHDKEMLSQGLLVIRKIELRRPRLRLIRERDGSWNLSGLMKPSPGQPILPTLVIHQGTIVLEDRSQTGGTPAVELSDVNLTLIDNPSGAVTVEANGKPDLAEKVQVRAVWRRQAKELTLSGGVRGIALNADLLHRFSGYLPPAMAEGLVAQGTVSCEAELHLPLGGTVPPTYKVRATLEHGSLRHPRVPLPFDKVEAKLKCEDGQVELEEVTALVDKARIKAWGKTSLPHPEQNFEVKIFADRLLVNDGLLERLPESFHTMKRLFRPQGPATLLFDCECRAGQYTRTHCFIRPSMMTASFEKFRYPIERITGSLDYDLLKSALKIDLAAEIAKQPISIKGTWLGKGDQTDADVLIRGANVPLDKQLIDALEPKHAQVAETFNPSGLADFEIHVRRIPGSLEFLNHYQARFHHAALKWDLFKYRLTHVKGVLDLYPKYWEFRDFEGTNGRGLVRLRGKCHLLGPPSAGAPPANRFQLVIEGQNVDLNEELYNALQPQPGTIKAWDTFQPAGRVDFRAEIDHVPGQAEPLAQNLDLTVALRDCTLCPRFFRCNFKDVTGLVHYAKNRVIIQKLQASHRKGSRFEVRSGTVDLQPPVGYYALLTGFNADPLIVDEEILEAMPEAARKALQALQLKQQPLQVETARLVVAQSAEAGQQPVLFWEGEARFREVRVNLGLPLDNVTGRVACTARHNGKQFEGVVGNVEFKSAELLKQPFHDVHSGFQIQPAHPDVVLLNLKAPIFGGDVSGQGKVVLGPNLNYELNLTASHIRLEEFARHNLKDQAEWVGQADGRLSLVGRGGGVETLDGNGSLDVRSGKLYNLPFLLDLLKFLGFRWPDRTLFEEAHAVFAIQGKRVRISRLDLLGNVISFWGKGEVNSDGSDVQLDFYPTWGRVDQLLPPVVRNIPPAISKMLIKIEARGRLSNNADDLQFHERFVPPLFDPILQLGDRWGGAERGPR